MISWIFDRKEEYKQSVERKKSNQRMKIVVCMRH